MSQQIVINYCGAKTPYINVQTKSNDNNPGPGELGQMKTPHRHQNDQALIAEFPLSPSMGGKALISIGLVQTLVKPIAASFASTQTRFFSLIKTSR